MLLDGCFIVPKIHCLHCAQVNMKMNKKDGKKNSQFIPTIVSIILV